VKASNFDETSLAPKLIAGRAASLFFRLFLGLALCALFWCFGLPIYADVPCFALFAYLAYSRPLADLSLLAGSLAFGLFLLQRGSAPKNEEKTFFRPHDRFERKEGGRRTYEKNVDVSFSMPYGDLAAVDSALPSAIREPRTVRFKTDRLGFVNDREVTRGQIWLLGDSFIANLDNDQRDSLANVLSREYGIPSYSASHGGGELVDYLRNFDYARRESGVTPKKTLLFVYEGNDFVIQGRQMAKPSAYDQTKISFLSAAWPLLHGSYQVLVMTRALEAQLFRRAQQSVEVHTLGGKKVAFYGSYVDASLTPDAKLVLPPEGISKEKLSAVGAVFFIPTKYRVYSPLLGDTGRRPVDPAPAFTTAKHFFGAHGIPVIDFTPRMRSRAAELLKQGKFLYWRDDTHWNAEGVKVGAEIVSEYLKAPSGS
jgi:hypothetical protein